MSKKIDLVLISVNSPLKCGIYQDLYLRKEFFSIQKTSDGLLEIFSEIFSYLQDQNLDLDSIFYARGPGSFTSLKLTHIFLQTLTLSLGVKLYSSDSFYFNQNAPISAFGNKFFIREDSGGIKLKELKIKKNDNFFLPEKIDLSAFDSQNAPLYILPPI
ncbi:hypothetical protein BKH41_03145 [Helicobacter sp. 12S02232-10]|uniref:hypothetical protein n=1 Tax=Helicobacter sp. 12S02232-10 TaxID=1476197 RepID=UPI000BA6C4AA|nr:hypothetical protein [Helicobacter sp. 12S02232-10]PAF49263.1 hypothetical protein BKH41_03145 [Helicobacter sp. 12S02232-10]